MGTKKASTAFTNKVITDLSNPFENDYTGNHKRIATGFTQLIEKQTKEAPLVVSLDAAWGVGKTTFIDMWGQQLLNDRKLAIKFDAWKWDHSDSPLLAIISELNAQLSKLTPLTSALGKVKTTGVELARILLPATLKLGGDWLLEWAKLGRPVKNFAKELALAAKDPIDEAIEKYQKKSQTIVDFKNALKEVCKEKTLFLFIDELDRCKPTFAIAVIEIIKHFFDVEGLCCVVSTNMNAFAATIGSLYGYEEHIAKGYLERFVDIPISLPGPKAKQFIEYKLSRTQYCINDKTISHKFFNVVERCCEFPNLSLRVIEKYLRDIQIFVDCNRLHVVDKRIPEDFYLPIVYRIILKRIHNQSVRAELLHHLNKDCFFEWSNKIFEANIVEEDLIKQLEALRAVIASFPAVDPSQIKELGQFSSLRFLYDRMESLYGTRVSIYNGKMDFPGQRLERYVNHFQSAEEIINLLSLTQENGDEETAFLRYEPFKEVVKLS